MAFLAGTFIPHFQRDIELTHSSGSAKIFFEDNGLPHIHADTRATAGFALGYLHAKDRLWQMDYLRRLSQGRLSEVLGSATIPVDEAVRVLQIEKSCKTIITQLESKEIEDYHQAYTDGINYYSTHNKLPLQYHILWTEFEEWNTIDSCTTMQLVRFFLSHNWGLEIARDYILALTNDEELMNSMFAFDPEYFDEMTTYIVHDEDLKKANLFSNATDHEVKVNPRVANISHYFNQEVEKAFSSIIPEHVEGGSNSWVIDGRFTKSGKPILVNDPHLTNQIPSSWYVAHIILPDGSDILGASITSFSLPVVISTKNIATAMTAVFADTSDVYEEIIEDGKYLYKGKYYPLEYEEQTIKVKGEPDVKTTLTFTRHGPLIDKHYMVLGHIDSNFFKFEVNHHFSMKWIGADPNE